MKSVFFVLTAFLFFTVQVSGQSVMKQLLIGSGGIYGNPSDHVTVTGFDPVTTIYNNVGEVWRESIQDLAIHQGAVFVAAEDSIVKFDIETGQKMASVFESNLSRLYIHEGMLYVSRRSDINGPPADSVYLKAYNSDNLELIGQTEGISSDAAGICIMHDTIYLAVPGDWQATEGRLAVVDMNLGLVREMNFGADAVGISDLYPNGTILFSVNKSPYLATTGSLTAYNTLTTSHTTTVFSHIFGKGLGKDGEMLYLVMDYGIGSVDLNTMYIADPSIIPDPGSANFLYIADAVIDTSGKMLYVTITDYFSTGYGRIYDLNGNQAGVFEAGISAEALEIQYENTSSINSPPSLRDYTLWPNPVRDKLNVMVPAGNTEILIIDMAGRRVLGQKLTGNHCLIDLSSLQPGIYYAVIMADDFLNTAKIIKR